MLMIDMQTMYDTALSHVYHLSSLVNDPRAGPDLLAKAKVFWYVHVHEGTTNALKGGKLVLSTEDLALFQDTLSSTPSSSSPQTSLSSASHYLSLALNIDAVCRQIHSVLTGPSARRQPSNFLNQTWLQDIWGNLESCWGEFETARVEAGGQPLASDDVDCFFSGWQIFIFECRESYVRRSL